MHFPETHFLEPPQKKNALGLWIERLTLCFFAVVTVTILYYFFSERVQNWRPLGYGIAGLYLLLLLLGCVLIAFRCKKQPPLSVLAIILLLSLGSRLCYVLLIPTEPVSDFALLYESAQAAAAGDFSWSQTTTGYFYLWAYQIPFVLYEAGVLRLFHSMFILELLNVLFMVGSNYLLYRIAKTFLSEAASFCVTFLYAAFPGAVMLASVLTNQHISLFFLLLGVFCLLQAKNWRFLLLAGLSFAVSNLMRPELIIILTAVGCCGLLRWMQHPTRESFLGFIASFALVFGSYWATSKLVELALMGLRIAPNGLANHALEWKFVLGLGNVEGYGSYSEKNVAILSIASSAARKKATLDAIQNAFANSQISPAHFFLEKANRFWTQPQSINWSTWNLADNAQVLPGLTVEGFRAYMQWFERAALLLVYLLALPAPVLLWRKENRKRGGALLCLAILCITFCVYLLIEIQPRYRYSVMPFWVLAGGITLEWMTGRLKERTV